MVSLNRLLDKYSRHTIVRWTNPVKTGYGGASFDSAVEIEGIWLNRNIQTTDVQGVEFISRSIVFTTTEISLGDWLYKGDLDDLGSSDLTNPDDVDGAYEVRVIVDSPEMFGLRTGNAYKAIM